MCTAVSVFRLQIHVISDMNWCMSNVHLFLLYGFSGVEEYKVGIFRSNNSPTPTVATYIM